MKAAVKKTIEISMSEEEAIRLGSEIEDIISEVSAMMEIKVTMSAANSLHIINDSIGPASNLRSLLVMLKYVTKEGAVSAS